MPIDKIDNDTRLYTDIQGLEQLHAELKNNPAAAKKQVAQQFEALLVQMMMKSMRDANKSFSSDLLQSNEMDFYQEMFDKQLSLNLSNQGLGVAKLIEANIDAQSKKVANPMAIDTQSPAKPRAMLTLNEQQKAPLLEKTSELPQASPSPIQEPQFKTKSAFIQALWSGAKRTASTLGLHPSILIAQAALETDWGKKMLNHNLFNIKADHQWKKESTTVDSLEARNGILVKEKSSYRAYPSIDESLNDYAHFIQSNQRYSHALTKTNDPGAYMNALQQAGYATDTEYAKKVMKIHESTDFKKMLAELK